MGLDAMLLVFWMLSFKPTFHCPLTLSSRSLVPLCFLPKEWYHLHIWGYWYFSQQYWFQLVLPPAQHFAWCTLHLSYISRVTIYSLDGLLSLFGTSLFMSSSNSCFLTWIQISQEAGQVVWYSHLLKNFPQIVVIHTVKGFGIVNKAEVDVFLELSCFLNDPMNVGKLISGSSAFSKSSLDIWKCTVHILLKPGLENFEHYFARVWDECNCAVVWAFFGLAFIWDWNENWPFPVLWPLLNFPNLLAYWIQHFHNVIF